MSLLPWVLGRTWKIALLCCLPSQDEYMADLYHFSTKEDSYASYFIKVSPLSHFSLACEPLLGYA